MSQPSRNLPRNGEHPWIFGSFAVYAPNPHLARHVYESVRAAATPAEPFGTVTLETGEVIDWVNIRFGVLCEKRTQ